MESTRRVPFFNWGKQYRQIEREVDARIKQVLVDGDLIMGKEVLELEQRLTAQLGVTGALSVANGTDALMIALRAAGIGSGDEVITVAWTFVASFAAIVHVGATPVLVDIRDDDMLIDVDQVAAAITPRTKAILPVHLNGRVCDMPALRALAERHGLLIIEDAAQAFGSSLDDVPAGRWGDLGCFSFFPGKVFGAFGDAGLISVRTKELADRVKLVRNHGLCPEGFALFGFNSRCDSIQAAVLNVKLEYVGRWIERRRHIAQAYDQGFADIAAIRRPPASRDGDRHRDNGYTFAIRVADKQGLFSHLVKSGIEVFPFFPRLATRSAALGFSHVKLPVTERTADECLALPVSPELEDEQVQLVIDTVRAFYA